jgi:hypothetical protein
MKDSSLVAKCVEILQGDPVVDSPSIKSVVCFNPRTNISNHRVKLTMVSPGNYKLTIGKPNYAECKFLKHCKRVGICPPRVWYKLN